MNLGVGMEVRGEMGVLGGCGIYKFLYKILYNICIIMVWDMYGIGWKIRTITLHMR